MQSLKDLLNGEKRLLWIFDGLVVIAAIFWLYWFYNTSFSSITVEEPAVRKPTIELDQEAYKSAKKYLDSIKDYKLPEISYTNSEPFREY